MTAPKLLPERKRLRLKGYDYSQGGGYFITIDVLGRRRLFGTVRDGRVELNDLGHAVAAEGRKLAQRHPGLLLDEFIVMPDHFHGILLLTSTDCDVVLPNVVDLVREFKSRTTRLYWAWVKKHGHEGWATQLWQRSYYERVLRSENDADEKRAYIRTNPVRYELKRSGTQ